MDLQKSSIHQTRHGRLIVWIVCCNAEMKSEVEEKWMLGSSHVWKESFFNCSILTLQSKAQTSLNHHVSKLPHCLSLSSFITNPADFSLHLFLHLWFIISAAIGPRLCLFSAALSASLLPLDPQPEDPLYLSFASVDVSLPEKLGSCPGLLQARPPDVLKVDRSNTSLLLLLIQTFLPVRLHIQSQQRVKGKHTNTHRNNYMYLSCALKDG